MAKIRRAKKGGRELTPTEFPRLHRRPSVNVNANQQVVVKLILQKDGLMKAGVYLTGTCVGSKPMSLGTAKQVLAKIGKLTNLIVVPDIFLPMPTKFANMITTVQRKNPMIAKYLIKKKGEALALLESSGGNDQPNEVDKGVENTILPQETGEK